LKIFQQTLVEKQWNKWGFRRMVPLQIQLTFFNRIVIEKFLPDPD